MFFKNKTTNLVWEVVHPDHIKRCQKDDNYEEVKVQPNKPEPKKAPKQTTKKVTE
jgi:hypothetical protein